MHKMFLAGAMLIASSCATAVQAQAQPTTFVVTPTGNTSSPGTNNVNSPFGAAGAASDTYVMQVQYAASMFTGVAIGSQLNSIGFRLAAGSTTIGKALNYTNFEIQVGSGANALGSLSRTFSANEGANTIVARTGALTIAKNSFVADACTNPNPRRCPKIIPTNSFYTIDFTTPYTYTGGDITLTFTSQLAAATVGQIVTLDAVDPQRLSTIVSTVGTSSSGSVPTRGLAVNFFYAPILQFGFTPPLPAAVPEPASWAMMLGGFGMLGAVMRTGKRSKLSFG